MLKLVLKNIKKKMYPYSILSKLRKGYYLLPNNIFDKQFGGPQRVMRSTNSDSKDKDHIRMCDKCNKIIEYAFGGKPYPRRMDSSKQTQKEKCEKLIAQVFGGVQQPAFDIHGNVLEPTNLEEANAMQQHHIAQCKATGDESIVNSSTTKDEREKLPQKIEKIEEPSVVEADPMSMGFIQKKATELQNSLEDQPKDPRYVVNAEPQTIVQVELPETNTVPENTVSGITTFKSNQEMMENCNFARSDGNRKSGTSDYENLTTTNRIDERIIKEMEKLGVPQTSPRETNNTMMDNDFLQIKNIEKNGPRKKIEKTDLELEFQSTDKDNTSAMKVNEAGENFQVDNNQAGYSEVEPKTPLLNFNTTLNTKPPEIMNIKSLENRQDYQNNQNPSIADTNALNSYKTKEKLDQLDTIIADLKLIKTESNLRRIEGQFDLHNSAENKNEMQDFSLFGLNATAPKENLQQVQVNSDASNMNAKQEQSTEQEIDLLNMSAKTMQQSQEMKNTPEESNQNHMNLANATQIQEKQEILNTHGEMEQYALNAGVEVQKKEEITVALEDTKQHDPKTANVVASEIRGTQEIIKTPEICMQHDMNVNIPGEEVHGKPEVTYTHKDSKQQDNISAEVRSEPEINKVNTDATRMQESEEMTKSFNEAKQQDMNFVNVPATEMQQKEEAMNTSEKTNESVENTNMNYAHITYTENKENAIHKAYLENLQFDGGNQNLKYDFQNQHQPIRTNNLQSIEMNENKHSENVIADLNKPNEEKLELKQNELNLTNAKSTETLKDEKEAVLNEAHVEPCLEDYYLNTCANGPENTMLTNMTAAAIKPQEDSLNTKDNEAIQDTKIAKAIIADEKEKELQEPKLETNPADQIAGTIGLESNDNNMPQIDSKTVKVEKSELSMDYKINYPYEPINNCQSLTYEPVNDNYQSSSEEEPIQPMDYKCEGRQCFEPKINMEDHNTSETPKVNDILPCHYDYNPVLTIASKPQSKKSYKNNWFFDDVPSKQPSSLFDKAVIHSADKERRMDVDVENDDCTIETNQFHSLDRSHYCTGSSHPLCMKPNETTRCYSGAGTETDLNRENVMIMQKKHEDDKNIVKKSRDVKEQEEEGAQEDLLLPDKPKVYKTGIKKNLKYAKDFGSLHMLSESSSPDVIKDYNAHELPKLPMKSNAWILKAKPHERLDNTEEIFANEQEKVVSARHSVKRERETTVADITNTYLSPEKLKHALDGLNEKIRHNISAGVGPITMPKQSFEHGHMPLSRMMRDLRMKSRLEYCMLFEKQLRDYQAALQADAATGSCGDKKVECPPQAPTCPPPPPKCPPKKPPCPPCPEKKMPCPPKKDPCAPKKKDPCAPKKKNPCAHKKKDDPCAKFTKRNVRFSDFFIIHKLPSEKLFPPIELTEKRSSKDVPTKQFCTRTYSTLFPFEDCNDHIKGSRDFEPWIPIPSWPYPMPPHRKPTCPPKGCMPPLPSHYHQPCPLKSNPKPCTGFPKRLTFSNISPRKILENINENLVYDIGEF